MSWQSAKEVAEKWCAENLADDLRVKMVQLIAFDDDETCRFFYRERDAGFHRMVTSGIAREARKRGAKTIYVTATRAAYDVWRSPRQDTAELRRQFIEESHRVLG